jgi:predicted Zn-dependent protease
VTGAERDRDTEGRARQARPRDALGRPLPYGAEGVEPVSEEPLPPHETLSKARQLIDDGRPFAAHEVLEARWKAGPAEEADLWQGLAQVCVALTHAARGNRVGAERLFERAGDRLSAFASTGRQAYGVDVTEAADQARRHIGTF